MTVKRISYEECNDLVLDYRDNSTEEAALNLLNAFEGYIIKFYNIVRRGRINMSERDCREFVKLYIKSEHVRRNVHRASYMPQVYQEVQNTVASIKKLCEPYSDDELKNEISAAFLIMAGRYKSPDGKPRFLMYLTRAFHFQLRRQLQVLTSDPIVFKIGNNLNFNEETYEIHESYDTYNIDNHIDQSPKFTIEQEMDTINENWVLGFTSNDQFSKFTTMERKIIKMYYHDDMSDQQIGEELGICRATVNRRRNKVKRELVDMNKDRFRVEEA